MQTNIFVLLAPPGYETNPDVQFQPWEQRTRNRRPKIVIFLVDYCHSRRSWRIPYSWLGNSENKGNTQYSHCPTKDFSFFLPSNVMSVPATGQTQPETRGQGSPCDTASWAQDKAEKGEAWIVGYKEIQRKISISFLLWAKLLVCYLTLPARYLWGG